MTEFQSKYLLPKLKSYSTNSNATSKSSQKKITVNSLTKNKNQTQSKMTIINKSPSSYNFMSKYQYVNKSPGFFRRKQLSQHQFKISYDASNTPIQSYVQQKIKNFEKESLIELLKNKAQKQQLKISKNNGQSRLTIDSNKQYAFQRTKIDKDRASLTKDYYTIIPRNQKTFEVKEKTLSSFRESNYQKFTKNKISQLKNNFRDIKHPKYLMLK